VEKIQFGALPLERDGQALVEVEEKAVRILESTGAPITITSAKTKFRAVSLDPIRRSERGDRYPGPHQQPTERRVH
jgi:hypothetical protein